MLPNLAHGDAETVEALDRRPPGAAVGENAAADDVPVPPSVRPVQGPACGQHHLALIEGMGRSPRWVQLHGHKLPFGPRHMQRIWRPAAATAGPGLDEDHQVVVGGPLDTKIEAAQTVGGDAEPVWAGARRRLRHGRHSAYGHGGAGKSLGRAALDDLNLDRPRSRTRPIEIGLDDGRPQSTGHPAGRGLGDRAVQSLERRRLGQP